MATLLGRNTTSKSISNQPTAKALLTYFKEKVAAFRHETDGVPSESSLPPASTALDRFEPYSAEDIQVTLASATKSCALDPLPKHILNKFLPELLQFLTDVQCITFPGLLTSQSTPCYLSYHDSRSRCQPDQRQELSSHFKLDISVENRREIGVSS